VTVGSVYKAASGEQRLNSIPWRLAVVVAISFSPGRFAIRTG
jgi:hypothetical protein